MESIKTTKTDLYNINPYDVDIDPGFNVRQNFDLDELTEQIKLHGVLNPITVIKTQRDGKERYRLVDGERRLRATLRAIEEGADIVRIKAIFLPKSTTVEEMFIQQVVRNEGQTFTEYEYGLMFTRFLNNGHKQSEIAKKFTKSAAFVSRCLSLMDLAPEVQEHLKRGDVSVNAVRSIIADTENEEEQVKAVSAAVANAKDKGKKSASVKDIDPSTKLTKEKKSLIKSLYTLKEVMTNNGIPSQPIVLDEIIIALQESESIDEAVKQIKEEL